ncbi:MAG: ribosome silencing factor [Alphaproteobacteria bacterium]
MIAKDHKKGGLTPEESKELILKSLDMDKAENIICIPLSDSNALADYMIIASGTSSRHVNALARKLKDNLQQKKVKGITIEGTDQCDWVVMDTGDIIVHLFRPEVRDFYNIEKMWDPASKLDIVDNQVQA